MASIRMHGNAAVQQPPEPGSSLLLPVLSGFKVPGASSLLRRSTADRSGLQFRAGLPAHQDRLHNRFLHGSGVVCGLEVSCSDCDGWVTVHPGYAIDPCGNDIIVCEPASLNVLEAIQECCDSRKRRRKSDCDPYRPPDEPNCRDLDKDWCITIKYQEREARGVMPLRNDPCHDGCGCGCKSGGCTCKGSNGHASNGYGANGHSKNASNGAGKCGCTPPVSKPQQPSQCEPTRIREGFKLCVVEDPGCDTREVIRPGTLLGNIRECLQLIPKFYAQFSPQVKAILDAIVQGQNPAATPQQIADACCRMRQALIDLISTAIFSVHCDLMRQVPPCGGVVQDPAGGPGNAAAAIDAIKQMNKILEQLLLDCLCHALLPPCGGDPCDDRLILACVTIRNGRILRICNFSCRTYAGSFPAIFYWLSAFPFSRISQTRFGASAANWASLIGWIQMGVSALSRAKPDTLHPSSCFRTSTR